jgi:N-acetylglucosaminyl-diphospho-decaprenol L-rhamnosyltransferase
MDAVVVTHNSAADIGKLAASQATTSAFARIVVVDNASSDDTVELARAAGFEVIAESTNHGFAAAANLGVGRTSGPVFTLLNPDVRLDKGDEIDRLARHLADARVGAVAPGLVLPCDSLQDSARRVPTPVDLVVRRFTGRQPDAVRGQAAVDVEWVVAACVVLRREAYERVRGLDERFFLYFEDVDLGVRLSNAGYRIRYDPTVRVFHDHRAASRSGFRAPATREHIRSAFRFYRAHPRYLRLWSR